MRKFITAVATWVIDLFASRFAHYQMEEIKLKEAEDRARLASAEEQVNIKAWLRRNSDKVRRQRAIEAFNGYEPRSNFAIAKELRGHEKTH